MAKERIAVIEQHAVPIRKKNYTKVKIDSPDGRGFIKSTDGYIGVARRVIARGMGGAILLDEQRTSRMLHSDSLEAIALDEKHHRGLNRWMENETARINRRLGNNEAEVQSDFTSSVNLAENQVFFVDLGLMHVEQFFLLRSVSNMLEFEKTQFAIQVDTDTEPRRPDTIRTLATHPHEDFPHHLWKEFTGYCGVASSLYADMRWQGLDVNYSQQAVEQSITGSLAV